MDNTREKLIELIGSTEYGNGSLIGNNFQKGFIEKMADHLIANGVTVFPCNVGQKIWMVYTPKHPANPIDKGKWFMVQDGVQRIIYGAKGVSIETWNVGTIPAKEIGKKLFFNRAEADARLQELTKGESL